MTNRQLKLLVFAFLTIILTIFLGLFMKMKGPFMFANITTVSTELAYSSPAELPSSISFDLSYVSDDLTSDYLSFLSQYLVADGQRSLLSDIDSVVKATHYLMSFGDRTSNGLARNLEDVLDKSGRYRNVCSEAAKVSSVLLHALGYSSRVVWGGNHVFTEVWNDETSQWILLDADGLVMAKNNGQLLNYLNTRKLALSDVDIFVPVGGSHEVDQQYNKELYSNSRFFVIIDANRVFELHDLFRSPAYIMSYVFLDSNSEVSGLQVEEPVFKSLGNIELF
ncbi:hypothetical protein [Vibrio brasiliensis]|uniref:Transglutaminase-like domain-containing protein n=1 Tax=Vibrio brasiliensis LMG 20546 TaxID=945543 RepID=E8M058_9VIBR|nr:hypothetical protein [Vibrio brasiliensis]EGA63710.1 hypothetical protein VIBR0546_16491 [Vibrio brasiliensis LMG 20546]